MSDYLWDKTGEADEDVAQLENLLGALKYQTRPLNLPDATPAAQTLKTPATAAAHTARPASFFTRPRLALAASLVLTLLAGLWLVTRQGEPAKNETAKVEQRNAASDGKQSGSTSLPNTVTNNPTPAATQENAVAAHNPETQDAVDRKFNGKKSDADGNRQTKLREDKASNVAASTPNPRRAPRQSVAKRQKLQPRVEENGNAPREEVVLNGGMRWQVEQPLTPQQREATEQLMFALRLASAKLNYAQREVRDIGRAGK